ncbi:MAG: LPS assembly lipoprotein LptE [Alphaproteobacteria bacterium]|nr:LPS assembly lipoprotein LptE [Alphaproteobacteria bacterium]
MSWLNRVRWVIIAGLISTLSACGFQPLYGSHGASGTDAVSHLAAIQIGPIADRSGQLLRNALRDKLTPRGRAANAAYGLDISLQEGRSDLVILQDATSTFAKLRIGAKYVLTDIASGRPLTRGTSESTTIFNIVESEFANLNAQSDARARAVNQISDDIRLRLGLFFRRHATSQGS